MRKNIRYKNSDRIKELEEENRYNLWWYSDYYSSSWEDEYTGGDIYYEIIGSIKYEPNLNYGLIDMDSIYDVSVIRDRKIESLLNPKKRFSKPTLGDLIKN